MVLHAFLHQILPKYLCFSTYSSNFQGIPRILGNRSERSNVLFLYTTKSAFDYCCDVTQSNSRLIRLSKSSFIIGVQTYWVDIQIRQDIRKMIGLVKSDPYFNTMSSSMSKPVSKERIFKYDNFPNRTCILLHLIRIFYCYFF